MMTPAEQIVAGCTHPLVTSEFRNYRKGACAACIAKHLSQDTPKAESSMTRRAQSAGRREDQRVAGSSAEDASDSPQGHSTPDVAREARLLAEQMVIAVDKVFSKDEKMRFASETDPDYRRRAIREVLMPFIVTDRTTTRQQGQAEGLEQAAHELCRHAQDPEYPDLIRAFAEIQESELRTLATQLRAGG